MISHADVEKLRGMRAPEPAVLSLYLPVPLDPVGVRGLAAAHGRDWLGSVECPGCGTAARTVPDLLEEMVQRTLDDDGPVTMIRDAPFGVAARLRFPLTEEKASREEADDESCPDPAGADRNPWQGSGWVRGAG